MYSVFDSSGTIIFLKNCFNDLNTLFLPIKLYKKSPHNILNQEIKIQLEKFLILYNIWNLRFRQFATHAIFISMFIIIYFIESLCACRIHTPNKVSNNSIPWNRKISRIFRYETVIFPCIKRTLLQAVPGHIQTWYSRQNHFFSKSETFSVLFTAEVKLPSKDDIGNKKISLPFRNFVASTRTVKNQEGPGTLTS